MNLFKENLKYKENHNAKQSVSKSNQLSHNAKRAALIGGLSIMAAVSCVGCSKSNSKETNPVTEQDSSQDKVKSELSENDKARQTLMKSIDEFLSTLENYPDSTLSQQDSTTLLNLLLKYVFIETSDKYNGDIPYTCIIPETSSASMSTFHISELSRKNIKNYSSYANKTLSLDSEAVSLYREYYSDILDPNSLKKAIPILYTVQSKLCSENKELLNDLTYNDLVNLMKSSYVSAYNNTVSTEDNHSKETIKASELVIYVNKTNDKNYSLTSYTIDDIGQQYLLETTLDTNTIKVIDDYVETYATFYEDSSDIENILSNLKVANETNQVSEEEIIHELTNITLSPENFNAYLNRTGLSSNTSEINDDGR